jgi:hypothetical protein
LKKRALCGDANGTMGGQMREQCESRRRKAFGVMDRRCTRAMHGKDRRIERGACQCRLTCAVGFRRSWYSVRLALVYHARA